MDKLLAAAARVGPNGGGGLGGNIGPNEIRSPISKDSGVERVQYELSENGIPERIIVNFRMKLRSFTFLDAATIDYMCEGDVMMAGIIRGVQIALKTEVEELHEERKESNKRLKSAMNEER